MNAQPDLFTPLARTSDPETSKAAGRSMRKGSAVQRDQIVNALRAHGPMNHWQLDDVLGLPHPSAARRMCELVRSGRVLKTLRTSKTGSGRQAAVYRAINLNVAG